MDCSAFDTYRRTLSSCGGNRRPGVSGMALETSTVVVPASKRVTVSGMRTPPAGGGSAATVTIAVPVLLSARAVMIAVPGATAFTTPVDETVATAGRLLSKV